MPDTVNELTKSDKLDFKYIELYDTKIMCTIIAIAIHDDM